MEVVEMTFFPELEKLKVEHCTLRRKARMIRDALEAAYEHLEYCGYGDSWERECAMDSGLDIKLKEALEIELN
jgi:hypothetical protein